MGIAVFLRPFRLLRLLQIKERYRNILGAIFQLLPKLWSSVVVVLLVFYLFAIIGMESFAFKVYRGCCNDILESSYYQGPSGVGRNVTNADGLFYLSNFDSLSSSFVTLFELMVSNNWFVVMDGITSETSQWSRLFFILFYLFVVN